MVRVSNQGQRTFKTFSGWQGGLKIPRPAYKFPPGNFTYFLRAVLCAHMVIYGVGGWETGGRENGIKTLGNFDLGDFPGYETNSSLKF